MQRMRTLNRHAHGRPAAGAGFTLLEIMIVLALLVLLGSLAVVGFTQVRARADRNAARVLVDQTVSAVNMYHTLMNEYPDNEQGLEALVVRPDDEERAERWDRLLEEVPRDPWGEPLRYERVETGFGSLGDDGPPFRVWSLGPDRQDGTEDDIRSWREE